jgi:hypothetical protein
VPHPQGQQPGYHHDDGKQHQRHGGNTAYDVGSPLDDECAPHAAVNLLPDACRAITRKLALPRWKLTCQFSVKEACILNGGSASVATEKMPPDSMLHIRRQASFDIGHNARFDLTAI